MKYWLLIALLLTGCGVEAVSMPTAGVHIDPSLTEQLRVEYQEVVECTGLEGISFDELVINLMPIPFYCEAYPDTGCVGEHIPFYTFNIGTPLVWKEEVVHHLLILHGVEDGDIKHVNETELFEECAWTWR